MNTDIDTLIDALGNDDYQVWQSAFSALQRVGEAAVEKLIAALQDDNAQRRINVAWLLGAIQDTRAVEPLIVALNDSNMLMRSAASQALGRIGDRRAVEPLITALETSGFWVAEGLGQLGDERAIDPLIRGMENDGSPREFVLALNQFDSERVIAPLIQALHSDDHKAQSYAQDGLARLGARAVEPLIASLTDDELEFEFVSSVITVLEKIKDGRAIEPLVNMLDSAPTSILYIVASALGEFSDPRAIEPLLKLQNNSDPIIKNIAKQALEKLRYIGGLKS